MKYFSMGIAIFTLMLVHQTPLFSSDETSAEDETRYRLPTAEYDETISFPEDRRILMSPRQLGISRAMKQAKQRRNRIALQKLTGRSISRPLRVSQQSWQRPVGYNFYYPYSGIRMSRQIHIQTEFE